MSNLETAIRQAIDELYNSQVDRNPMYSDGYNDALRHVLEIMEGAVKRLVQEMVQDTPKVLHLKDWDATAMLTHARERIASKEACVVLFYEDGELKHLSSNVDNQHAVWMFELAKMVVVHQCITHEWETS